MPKWNVSDLCRECAVEVWDREIHDRWHADHKAMFDSVIEGFKVRDNGLMRIVDAICEKPVRPRYRRPLSDEEKAEMEAVVRELGILNDAGRL